MRGTKIASSVYREMNRVVGQLERMEEELKNLSELGENELVKVTTCVNGWEFDKHFKISIYKRGLIEQMSIVKQELVEKEESLAALLSK